MNDASGADLREVQLNLNRAVDLVLHDADLLFSGELKHCQEQTDRLAAASTLKDVLQRHSLLRRMIKAVNQV
jgi:hypothetical protein